MCHHAGLELGELEATLAELQEGMRAKRLEVHEREEALEEANPELFQHVQVGVCGGGGAAGPRLPQLWVWQARRGVVVPGMWRGCPAVGGACAARNCCGRM